MVASSLFRVSQIVKQFVAQRLMRREFVWLVALLVKQCVGGEERGDLDAIVDAFVAKAEAEAYDAMLGFYGENIKKIDEEELAGFVETYVTQRLEEETARVLEEKGWRLPAEAKTWQTAQAGRLAALDVEASGHAQLAAKGQRLECLGPDTPCGQCGRVIIEDLASFDEVSSLRAAAGDAMVSLYRQGGSTSIAVDDAMGRRLGVHAPGSFDITTSIRDRARNLIQSRFNTAELYYSGGLISRLEEPPRHDSFQLNSTHEYWNAHVDKANIVAYDYSALVYLSEYDSDFAGGELEFYDDLTSRTLVHPKPGLLVAFSSGLENVHRVRRLKCGQRFVLALWFTCDPSRAFVDNDEWAIRNDSPRTNGEVNNDVPTSPNQSLNVDSCGTAMRSVV